MKQLETGSPGERVIAAELLGDLGPAALAAAPTLAQAALGTKLQVEDADGREVWNDPDMYLFDACRHALQALGPKAAAEHGKVLEHDEFIARQFALHSFQYGDTHTLALPALVKCMATRNGDVIEGAARGIAALGPKAEAAIPALVERFLAPPPVEGCSPGPFGGFPQPRLAIVAALVKIGPKAHPAIRKDVLPRLAAELKGEEKPWDFSGYDAILNELAEVGEPLVPTLVELARNAADAPKRAVPMGQLLLLGKAGRTAFGGFATDLKPDTCRAVVLALQRQPTSSLLSVPLTQQSKPDISPLLPQVLAALRDEDPVYRRAALAALGRADRLSPDAIAAVRGLLDDPALVRLLSQDELWPTGLLGPLMDGGDEGVKAVVGCLKHRDPLVRASAARALGNRRAVAKPHLPALRDVARADTDPKAAAWAAVAAAKASLDPADLDRVALRSLDANTQFVVSAVASVLRSKTTPPLPRVAPPLAALPVLVGLLPLHRGDMARGAVWEAIGRYGPTAAAALPVLRRELRAEKDDGDRIAAVLCFAAIGPHAKDALPELRRQFVAPSPALRLAAAFALARIENDVPKYRAVIVRTARRVEACGPNGGVTDSVFASLSAELPELLPKVLGYLSDERVYAAVRSYGAASVPSLRERLKSLFPSVEAARLLGDLGPVAQAALPELLVLLDGDDVELAVAARDAIRKIEAKWPSKPSFSRPPK